MTDCFQPIEKIHRVTYRTIQELNKRRIGYLIVTKSAMVSSDEYLKIYDKDLAHIQVTVTTLDDSLASTYEHASPPSKRIESILKLQDAGYDVAIRLSPIIEPYMDFDALNGLGIQRAIVEFLRVNTWVRRWFDIDYSPYTLKQGGYNHLTMDDKLRILRKIMIDEVSVCEDYTEHYLYWRDHFNPNPNDCCNLRKPSK